MNISNFIPRRSNTGNQISRGNTFLNLGDDCTNKPHSLLPYAILRLIIYLSNALQHEGAEYGHIML